MEFYEPETQMQVKPDGDKPKDAKTEEHFNKFENKVESVVTNIQSNIQQNTQTGWSSINGLFSNIQKNLPTYQKTLNESREQAQKRLAETTDVLGKRIGSLPKALPLKEENLNEIKAKSGVIIKSVNDNTNKYLDDLDAELEKVENFTLGYATNFVQFG
ncbi:unnamed protein product [Ambrosiozyma monospora]|uniref:Unnamed protein product n=1 Tax=Ambrosiozyma monospora TaxID=43982 RepID=A0ACB5THS1_AMBMO|nr:unnamed protein product [Ambrosiozyma monospora]